MSCWMGLRWQLFAWLGWTGSVNANVFNHFAREILISQPEEGPDYVVRDNVTLSYRSTGEESEAKRIDEASVRLPQL